MSIDTTRADMHVHSSASEISRLGVQRSVALPECATAPEEVYTQAKRRGMDFVTITDHDTISGVLTIADRPDVFLSEELTVAFRGETQAVHVLCYGITPDDHDWLQGHNDDVEACAEYLATHDITAALAHPFYAVAAPLTMRHRRRLAELFPVWETRNGARAKELNLPAFVYIETRGGTAIGGSDDHAGVDIGRTYTATPPARSPEEFLAHIRAGRASAHGDQGSATKWTHAAIALAIRALDGGAGGGSGVDTEGAGGGRVNPASTLAMIERVLREGDARHGETAADLGPDDARGLLTAWLGSLGLRGGALLSALSEDRLSHADLARRARAAHEQRLAEAVAGFETAMREPGLPDLAGAVTATFSACLPAIPYAAATAFLGAEKRKLARRDGDSPRVAIVADGLDAMHGVSAAVRQIRERGVRGFEVEVVGTDTWVDRRLSSVAALEVPSYPGLTVGVPSLPGLVEALVDGGYDLLHVCTPGPVGLAAAGLAPRLGIGLLGSHHTELGAYAAARSGRPELEALVDAGLRGFLAACRIVLSPSPASDGRLAALGIAPERIMRWDRGVDLARFAPERRVRGLFPGEVNVLYAGRIAREKGVELLAAAFERAREEMPGLHLVLAGVGPEARVVRARLGDAATFLGRLDGEDLARAYASADAFLFASETDTFGQVILEAQASGLPVVAVGTGGPASLVEHGVSGLLTGAGVEQLAQAVLAVTSWPLLAERLRRGGLAAVRERSWEASMDRLAAGYRRALEVGAAAGARASA